MLSKFLLALLFLDSLVLITAVLLQAGQGGGVAATFGGVSSSASSFLGTRQTGNLLTKASWWAGGIFLFLAFVLSLASTQSRAPRSVLDQAFPNAPAPAPVTAPAPTTPGGATPGVDLTPAPTPGAAQGAAPAAPAPAAPTTKKP